MFRSNSWDRFGNFSSARPPSRHPEMTARSIGVFLLAQEEIGLIDAIDSPVIRNVGSNNIAQGAKEIMYRYHAIGFGRFDLSRPLDHGGGA